MKRRDMVRPEDERDWTVDENWEIEQKRRHSRNLVLKSFNSTLLWTVRACVIKSLMFSRVETLSSRKT